MLGDKGVVHVDVKLGPLLLELPPLGSLEMINKLCQHPKTMILVTCSGTR